MSAKKVSELSETTTFSDTAYVPVVDAGVTYKMSLENLLQKTLRTDKPSEISSVDSKTAISNGDFLMLEDSASSNTKKSCTKAQFLHDVPQVSTGSADPSDAPYKKGLIYINTTTGDIFISSDSSASSDWKAIYVAP